MSWTNKAVLAWGWILTPEEIATLSDEVYEEWLDNEWLISSEASDEKIFTYFSVDADESPKNVTDVTELVSEIGNEEFFSRPTKEYFEQLQEHFEFFSSKQFNYYLILREQEYNYCIDDLIAGGRS